MIKKRLSKHQHNQEKQYNFPYHYLDLVVDEYKFVRNIEMLSRLKIIKQKLVKFKGKSILDVGCGDGRFCYELMKEGIKVEGIDYSEQALSFARAFNPRTNFYLDDLTNLKLKKKFDVVVLVEVLEHIDPHQISKVMENISKVLKKGGKLIISVPSQNLPLQDKHYQHFSPKSLSNILQSNFAVKEVFGYGRIGWRNIIFSFMRQISYAVFPWRKKINIIGRYIRYMGIYYQKYLSKGVPENCLGLIVECQKT